jgi:hypothetical protein
LLTVELKGLNKQAGDAAEYLKTKAGTRARTKGTTVLLEDLNARQAKLLLHKYLHHMKLDGYRVVVVHSGLLEVVPASEIRHGAKREKGSPPSAPTTMPYYFPNGSVPLPTKKSKTRRNR